MKIGKVQIRLSPLEPGRVYTHTYPLLVLHPSGVKKMGELHLAIRFSCTSMVNMMFIYSRPLLPKMHYVRPLTMSQLDMLRHQAVNIIAARLSRAEPPLRKEVIEYMTDAHLHLWSMRRSKASFLRLMSVFKGLFSVGKWFGEAFELRASEKYPPHMNTRMSCADAVHPDELDEEFGTFPTSKSAELVRYRYDRLRSVAGKIQTVVGDVASQGERFSLSKWARSAATTIFVIFAFLPLVLYSTPLKALVAIAGFM
ncbi:FT-interacting protein 4 [Camellia lanceoleosa]|uniref:FT-interacting protein 4 n=1 Tax=Camellia lanceoleosa TaxID=1840588 RepID=A0ACC0FNZ7_9ERIC|nr:FT-interacting protein 4 [Camellia lanceoleosa]